LLEVIRCVLEAMEVVLCLLEMSGRAEVPRCMLLCMLEVMRCALLCMVAGAASFFSLVVSIVVAIFYHKYRPKPPSKRPVKHDLVVCSPLSKGCCTVV